MQFVRRTEDTSQMPTPGGGYPTIETRTDFYGVKTSPTLAEVQMGIFNGEDLIVIMPGAKPNPGEKPSFLPADIVPRAVVQAQMELAGLIYGGLNPLAPVERGGKVVSMSESTKEGDLDVIGGDSKRYSVTYAESAPVETYLPAVYGILGPYLREIPGKSGIICGRVAMG